MVAAEAEVRRHERRVQSGLGSATDSPFGDPVEQVWSHLKRSLTNLTKHTIAKLIALVKTQLRRMQYRPRCWPASPPTFPPSQPRRSWPGVKALG